MCDPLTIAGVALTAGSTALNGMAQSKISKARDDAMAAERIRQQGYDREADALNTQSQDRFQDTAGQEQAAATKLADYFTGQEVAEPAPEAAVPTSANNLVVREEQKQRAKARDFTDRTGTALGNLRAFGDVLGANSRLQARDAMSIGQIGGFKRGSSDVLPFELEAANQKGAGLGTLASLFGAAGGVSLNAGLSGANPFGAAAAPTQTTLSSHLGILPTVGPVPTSRVGALSSFYPAAPKSPLRFGGI
jgi:hypothetical protein